MPRCWAKAEDIQGLLLEFDVPFPKTKLQCKVVVFSSKTALRRFWKKHLELGDLGSKTLAAVNPLSSEVWNSRTDEHRLEVDPRYFAVCGLVKGHLGAEIVTHEAVHIGFAFYSRKKGRLEWRHEDELDEENVAYPAGIAASAINEALWDAGFYKSTIRATGKKEKP